MCLSPARQRSRATNSFYQIEKLTCEAKPKLPGTPGQREARDPVMLDGQLAGQAEASPLLGETFLRCNKGLFLETREVLTPALSLSSWRSVPQGNTPPMVSTCPGPKPHPL